MGLVSFLLSLLVLYIVKRAILPLSLKWLGRLVGYRLRRASQTRQELLWARTADERRAYEEAHCKDSSTKKELEDWEEVDPARVGSAVNGGDLRPGWQGVVGFFHPFCNAGGGGERVLWEAILATQRRWPEAMCVVYTGDHNVGKDDMLRRVKDRFNIGLHSPNVHFLYLTKRDYVEASTWPHFTLAGQSLGSIILAWDAFQLLVPDIFIDTMGYAFAVGLSSWLFPYVPTAAYVHYPTISTDMLDSLADGGQGIHAGAGVGYKGLLKRIYWHVFAWLYSKIGAGIDVVMTNSTWTQNHIKSLWGPYRKQGDNTTMKDIDVVFPPVAVEEVEKAVSVDPLSEKETRKPYILYIAQFRPEKNHELILRAFASFVRSKPSLPTYGNETPKLVLVGSVREADDIRIYKLRLLARELHIDDQVEFALDAKWPKVLEYLGQASVGVNGMWSEHFGIGVVEYQAAGLISVVNDSGGPKLDIVIDVDGKPTGFHASTEQQYTEAFKKALTLSPDETLAMRGRARKSARRFTDRAFAKRWLANMEILIGLQVDRTKGR